ncbi:MAG: tyrosine-protein phosphatase [Actinobacteria bacterium]|nr:tyrosine-protein phosphatase [Actinomycetota bacterium]
MRDRTLAWDGCLNVRDLGGHTTEDGFLTRFGAVVRADSIRQLSDAGWAALAHYGVGRIVDLRFHDELEADPPREVPAEVVHVPVFPDPATGAWAEIDALSAAAPDHATATRDVYLTLLRLVPEGFAAAVEAVADAPEGAVVIHCTAGKDRTGLVTALLLRLAGVSVADVAADYALSAAYLRERARPWVEEAETEEELRRRERIIATPAEAMVGVLEELRRRFGGVAGYLREGGADDEMLERARARLRG